MERRGNGIEGLEDPETVSSSSSIEKGGGGMGREYAKERRGGGGGEGQNGRITLEMKGRKRKEWNGNDVGCCDTRMVDGPRMKMMIMMMTNNASR